jgi:hypothetical protein
VYTDDGSASSLRLVWVQADGDVRLEVGSKTTVPLGGIAFSAAP